MVQVTLVLVMLSLTLSWLDHLRHVRDQDTIAGLRREVESLQGQQLHEAIVAETRHMDTTWRLHTEGR